MPAPAVPKVKFSNGRSMPMLGLGTSESLAGNVERAVKYAIDNGYRHIDTAFAYDNEKEIGNAIREKIEDGTVTREDLFITTKIWGNTHAEDKVVPTCRKSLANLGLDYVDLYLIHWPFGFKEGDDLWPKDSNGKYLFSDIDYLDTWKGMEECVRLGLARSIGVSNFNSQQITRLMGAATIKPVNNQVEVNVNFNQRPLIEFCKQQNITVTAYSPLGRPGNRYGVVNSLDNPKIQTIAEKYKKTPAQIALRYLHQLGVTPIPKSVTESRIKENIDIFNFELTPEEVATIDSVGTKKRIFTFEAAKDHKYYPFSIPF
ncbi:1,5-anhydro-D-fructose reductase [Diachasma alloeum]|uniref:1,5-anhydro-D-fructose reductase n=1 Tax=Diachasma alloeum TaxID=454923 RepID=UPI0007384074|nr:1,5-anhydro-D-fructose reductase [Diachasma alloeum]